MSEVKGFTKLVNAPQKITTLAADLQKIITDATSALKRFEDQDADNLAAVKLSEDAIGKILRRLSELHGLVQNSGAYCQEILKVDAVSFYSTSSC